MNEDARALAAARLQTALDLFETGRQLRRAQLKRQFPDAGDDELNARLLEWVWERPGAEFGDAVGRPGTWPRRRRDR